MTNVQSTTWHGFPSFSLESELMRVVIVPALGAKIVSIFDKRSLHEWLVPPMRPLKQTHYGADFVSQDMSGWDEMLPTIVACSYQGVNLPDHGEVWSIPWQIEKNSYELVLSVTGVVMPYRLTRSARLIAPDRLELGYQLTHTGKTSFPYLWAAHPQFTADEHTRLLLPSNITEMVNVIDADPAWGKAGELVDWPAARDIQGRTWRLDRVRSAEHRACRKFYVPPDQSALWAALLHEHKGCQLRLEWSPDELPYLGLWVDEGRYNSQPAAAFEPSNAYYDSLVRATANGKVSTLEPGLAREWTLHVKLNS